jgi:iron complex outermembrane recepter protein
MHRPPRIVTFVVAILLSAFHISECVADADVKSSFDIPAEALDKALRDFAIQANCNISYEPMITTGIHTPAIKGSYTRSEVLSMLLKGRALMAVNVNEDTIQVVERSPASPQPAPPSKSRSQGGGTSRDTPPGSALPSSESTVPDPKGTEPDTADAGERRSKDLQEITVTGTHIRGAADSASPVEIYTRDDIDATGANTVAQFLQTLPQNFGGGASENTANGYTGSGQTTNSSFGSAPNLRGLGADATLVLINGHRVAPGSSDGSFVDVSMIPLTAIERVEIVTDGASAIYGADAVGGVVNFILRSKFDGAETRAQYGSVTSGSMHNVQAGQTVGKDWGSGSAVLSYQYFDQTPLSAGSRDYLRTVPLPFDILPEQIQQAVFANIRQDITPGWGVHADLTYSHRSTSSMVSFGDPVNGYETQALPAQINGYSASFGSTLKLPRESELTLSATYSESDTNEQAYATPSSSPLLYVTKAKSDIISVDGNLDGVLTSLPAGALRYAVGAQYRSESFENRYLVPATDNAFHPSRRVGAGYAELRVPLVAANSGTHGEPALQLTLADRTEHYSDFGSTNNPQVGAIWKPWASVALRGTYGTSFKAPLLSELNPVPSEVVIFPASVYNPAPGGTVNTLNVYGGNPQLKPEKATSWTLGLDFKPEVLPGFNAKLTYYNIVFKDEIAIASASVYTPNIFIDEAILGPQILQRNPSAALVQQLVSQPTYVEFYPANPATVGAIFDSRSMNLSTATTSGLDFRLGFKEAIGSVLLETGVDGTYILKFDNQFTDSSPATSVLNTEFNPTKIRLRGREILTYGRMTAGLYVNYTNAYTNNGVQPEEHVASWITEDAVVSYQFGSSGMPFGGVSTALSVINLTGRDPPYLANPGSFGINFDGANANALGRYISLRLQKRW